MRRESNDNGAISVRRMVAWLRDGRVKYREDVTDGLENAPRELIGLPKGENFGKKLIRVGPDPTRRPERTPAAIAAISELARAA